MAPVPLTRPAAAARAAHAMKSAVNAYQFAPESWTSASGAPPAS
jgi:hypothetical protein